MLVRITVNGQSMDVAEGTSVDVLLRELAVARQFTAVAVNREITPKSAYATTLLSAGDRVEIVKPMGGG